MKCRLLFNEEPITINRLAANVLGLNEAIVVQQIHYWLNINEKAKINIHDGHVWTYNTYDVWQKENFTFWSVRTLKSIFKKLEDKGILIKGNYNKKKYDRTLWITLDYNKLEELLLQYENNNEDNNNSNENIENVEISTKCKNDTMSDSNKVQHLHDGECNLFTMDSATSAPPIPKTTKDYTETSISTTHKDAVVEKIDTPNTNKELIESNTHLIIDSSNKEYKIKKWKKDRLLKAIDIFKQQEGIYFSLLEKIYKDDKNFAIYELKTSDCDFNKATTNNKKLNPKIHNYSGSANFMKYSEDELERILLENNKKKFK